MTWCEIYLAIGVLIALVMCFIPAARAAPPLAFMLTILVVALFWPLAIIAGILNRMSEHRDV